MKKKLIVFGIISILTLISIPTTTSNGMKTEKENVLTGDIEFPEENGPYKLTVLFSKWSSVPDFIKISKDYTTIGPLVWMSNNSLRMAYNCIGGYEVVFVDGVNQKALLDSSVSRRVEGFGFKGFQLWSIVASGMCDYIDFI